MAHAGTVLESAFRAAIVRTFRRDCVDIHFPPLAGFIAALFSFLFPPLHDVAVEYRCTAGAILHLLGGLVRYTNRSKESERLGLAEEVHSLAWAKLNPPVPV